MSLNKRLILETAARVQRWRRDEKEDEKEEEEKPVEQDEEAETQEAMDILYVRSVCTSVGGLARL